MKVLRSGQHLSARGQSLSIVAGFIILSDTALETELFDLLPNRRAADSQQSGRLPAIAVRLLERLFDQRSLHASEKRCMELAMIGKFARVFAEPRCDRDIQRIVRHRGGGFWKVMRLERRPLTD